MSPIHLYPRWRRRTGGQRATRWWAILRLAGWFVLVASVAVVAWSLLTHVSLRVDGAQEAKRLAELDSEVEELARQVLDSQERADTTIDFGARKITPEYVVALNRLADRALQVRRPFLRTAHRTAQDEVLSDIVDLVEAMDGCGSLRCSDIEAAIEEHHAAMTAMWEKTESLGAVMAKSHDLLSKHDGTPVENAIRLHLLLRTVMFEQDMLVHTSKRGDPFADVQRLMTVTWKLSEIRQQLSRDYEQDNRIYTALRLIIGR